VEELEQNTKMLTNLKKLSKAETEEIAKLATPFAG
jgi:hypothetical protein